MQSFVKRFIWCVFFIYLLQIYRKFLSTSNQLLVTFAVSSTNFDEDLEELTEIPDEPEKIEQNDTCIQLLEEDKEKLKKKTIRNVHYQKVLKCIEERNHNYIELSSRQQFFLI